MVEQRLCAMMVWHHDFRVGFGECAAMSHACVCRPFSSKSGVHDGLGLQEAYAPFIWPLREQQG